MPKINEMLLKLKGFQYTTSLDLNMGYYHCRYMSVHALMGRPAARLETMALVIHSYVSVP